MTQSLTYADSIVIDASPAEVYALVSDVARTGEWSPICRECWWDEGEGPAVGSFFTGRNVTPERTWETRCEVVAAEPGAEFGWSVNGGAVFWRYAMKAAGSGTELTESWEFTEAGQELFKTRFGDAAAAQIAAREKAAHEGIPATLAAMKRLVEATPAG